MWQYVAFHPQITITITEELKTSLLFFFENFFLVFIRDFSPLSGFNTASRPQYIAIPLSFDNTWKNLLARIEIPKKSKIIAPYCTFTTVVTGASLNLSPPNILTLLPSSSRIPLIAGPSITSNFTFIWDFCVERPALAECALKGHLFYWNICW